MALGKAKRHNFRERDIIGLSSALSGSHRVYRHEFPYQSRENTFLKLPTPPNVDFRPPPRFQLLLNQATPLKLLQNDHVRHAGQRPGGRPQR